MRSSKLPNEIQDVARRKLRMLANSQNLSDLKIPPSNHLEKLSGNLAGKFSIRINQKWRQFSFGKKTRRSKSKLLTIIEHYHEYN
jgi:plasmid maintenance system killer protein